MLTVVHDLAHLADGRHAGHSAFLADIGGHAFKRHDSAGAGLFRDDSLLRVGDVHNHAALQHFSETDLQAESFIEVHWFSLDHCRRFGERRMRTHALQLCFENTTENGDSFADLIRRHPGKTDA